jgi:hypothetical protein
VLGRNWFIHFSYLSQKFRKMNQICAGNATNLAKKRVLVIGFYRKEPKPNKADWRPSQFHEFSINWEAAKNNCISTEIQLVEFWQELVLR